MAGVVPKEFEALKPTEYVPGKVGIPTIADRPTLKVNPGGELVTPSKVAPVAVNSYVNGSPIVPLATNGLVIIGRGGPYASSVASGVCPGAEVPPAA